MNIYCIYFNIIPYKNQSLSPLYDKYLLCYNQYGDYMLINFFRKFARLLKIKKVTIKQFEEAPFKPFVKKQLLQKMQDGVFEVYHIKFLWKNIAQVFIFYNLEEKSLADGENVCYVSNIYVTRIFRGLGLCSRCIEKVKSVAKDKGFSIMILGVMEDNTNAIRLYKKLGFVETGEKYAYDAIIIDKNGNKIPQKEYMLMRCEL